jgi:hypothetical protein
MRAEESRPHRDAIAELACSSKHLCLACGIEAVPRLDLDGGSAFGEPLCKPAPGSDSSSASEAPRVARTVDRIPPPARAISS